MEKEIWITSYSQQGKNFHLEPIEDYVRYTQWGFISEKEITDFNMVGAFDCGVTANNFVEHLRDQKRQRLGIPRKKLFSDLPRESETMLTSWIVSYSPSEATSHIEPYDRYVDYVRQGFFLDHPIDDFNMIGAFGDKEKAELFLAEFQSQRKSTREKKKASKLEIVK